VVVSMLFHYNRVMQELQPTSIRLAPELKEALRRFAQEDRRSLSSYIVLVLEQHIAAREKAKKKSR
jgi:predicted DNA-binding protein